MTNGLIIRQYDRYMSGTSDSGSAVPTETVESKEGLIARSNAMLARSARILSPAWWVLIVLLVTGFGLRKWAADYGLPYEYHWDEPEIMQSSIQILRNGTYWPVRSDRIGYLFLNKVLYAGWTGFSYLRGSQGGLFPEGILGLKSDRDTGYYWTVSYPYLWLQARYLSALLGCLSIAFTFAAGMILGGGAVAIASGAVMAYGAAQVFSTTLVIPDAPALAATSICLWASAALLTTRAKWAYITAAVSAAAAAGFKVNYAPVFLMPVAAHAFSMRPDKARFWDAGLVRLMLWFAVFAIVFQVDAILYPTLFLHDYSGVFNARIHTGITPHGLSSVLRGYSVKTLALFDAGEFVGSVGSNQPSVFKPWARGFPLVFLAVAGFLYLLRFRPRIWGMLVLMTAGLLIAMGAGTVAFFTRYLLPAAPAAAVIAGFGMPGVVSLLRSLKKGTLSPRSANAALTISFIVAFLPILVSTTLRCWRQHRFVDPRVQLSQFMLRELPKGTAVAFLDETRWNFAPEEKAKFKVQTTTIARLLHSPLSTTETQYLVTPLRVAYGQQMTDSKAWEKQMNDWLASAKPVKSFGTDPSVFGLPPKETGVKLVRNDNALASRTPEIPVDVIRGTAFDPGPDQEGAATLADETLAVKTYAWVTSPVRITHPVKTVVIRAKGTSPTPQETLPVVQLQAAATEDTAFRKPLANCQVTIHSSGSGMISYEGDMSLPQGTYLLRLRPVDPDKRIMLIESVELK